MRAIWVQSLSIQECDFGHDVSHKNKPSVRVVAALTLPIDVWRDFQQSHHVDRFSYDCIDDGLVNPSRPRNIISRCIFDLKASCFSVK